MVLAEEGAPGARPVGMTTMESSGFDRPDIRGLAPPSGLPRRLVLVGAAVALAGLASLLAALVAGVLVGFDDPAATPGPTPSPSLAVALTLAGAAILHAGRLFARADARVRR
jgi:hypothetical protein